MKNFRLLTAFTCLILFLNSPAFGQRYKTAAGIRIDDGLNLTFQQYITNGWTAEGILHTPIMSNNFGATLLAEKHHKILFRGLNFYAGGGVHYYGVNQYGKGENAVDENNVWGLSGIGGAELSIGRINFAVDWKPELHLSGNEVKPFDWNGASISVRYIIAKRERKTVKDWGIWDKFGRRKK